MIGLLFKAYNLRLREYGTFWKVDCRSESELPIFIFIKLVWLRETRVSRSCSAMIRRSLPAFTSVLYSTCKHLSDQLRKARVSSNSVIILKGLSIIIGEC